MATMLADQEVLWLFTAIYNNDLQTVQTIVQGGLDPKHVQFVIQTDEICMCSAVFENLGLDFLEESLPTNVGLAWSSSDQSRDQTDGESTSTILQWLESGMCNHVALRNQNDEMIIYESDEFDYESDDDLDKELDLEIYGIKVTPQPSLPGEFTPKSPAVMSPFSPHLHPQDAIYRSESPAVNRITQLDKIYDMNKELTAAFDKIAIGDIENSNTEVKTTATFRCMAPCPDDQPALSPGYFTESETASPDVELNLKKRQSVAEILAAAESDRESTGIVTITPLVSPLKISSSAQETLETVSQDIYCNEEIIEADVKFAGMTPLHVAASRGHDQILQYLLSQGCNVNGKTMETGDTPIHLAARWGHATAVNSLLRGGAELVINNDIKYSPLDLAIESGNSECVNILLDHIISLEEINEEIKKALLIRAIKLDKPNLVSDMLQKFSIDINAISLESNWTLLHKSAACGAIGCLKLFINLKCEIHVPNDEGETALHLAAGNGNSECVLALLQGGAKPTPAPNWMIGDNQTPLMMAAYNNYFDVVTVLIPYDDINCVSEYGDSALHYAASKGCPETLRALIEAGANVNLRNCYNATPLWNGVTKPEVLELLLSAGAATNIPSTGYTLDGNECIVYEAPKPPLEVALAEGYFDCAKILLQNGCKTFSNIMDFLKVDDEYSEKQEAVKDVKAIIMETKPLKFLVKHFIKETIGENNAFSVIKANEVIDMLPVLNEEVKRQLFLKYK